MLHVRLIYVFSIPIISISRAQLMRPGYNEVEQGVNKSRDAIENCLCRDGFTFDGMKEVYCYAYFCLTFKISGHTFDILVMKYLLI